MRRLAVRIALVVAGLLAADQLVLYTVLRDGRLLGRWIVPFDPPLFTDAQRARLDDVAAILAGDDERRGASLADPELGWCPQPERSIGVYDYDWAGARIARAPLAREKRPGVRRIVAVGGSFTAGAEVGATDTWLARVEAEHEGLEVANLGIAGYGPDQAFLRYRRDGKPLAPDEVWLGYMPGATLRITTLFPPVYRHWSSVVAFKPRFELDASGALVHVPSPAQDFGEFDRLLHDQARFVEALARDFWVRRTPAAFAPRGTSWTHWFATTRLLVTGLESGDREPAAWLADPESEVYRLMAELVASFAAEARADGAVFRLIVVPSRPDLQACRAGSPAYWSRLVADLERRGISTFDAGPALLAAGAATDDALWMPEGHYAPAANGIVADAVLGWLP